MKTKRAQAIPDAFYENGAWYLPPEPGPTSARIGNILFPKTLGTHPTIAAAAARSVLDIRPIDLATARWRDINGLHEYPPLDDWGRLSSEDPWQRVAAAARARSIEPHLYQRIDADYAIHRLSTVGGAYLGWEMGLGKTLGACMVADGWDVNFMVVACPNSAKLSTWLPELECYCPWMKPIVLGNTAKARAAQLAELHARMKANEPTAFVLHYEALRLVANTNKSGTGWNKFGVWDLAVFDEAHRLRKPKAQFVRQALKLKAVGRLLLSGSITDGNAEDLFVPMKRMDPVRYRRRQEDWIQKYVHQIEDEYGMVSVGPQEHRLPELRAELGRLLVVRLAKDELDIPEPHQILHRVEMLPAQRKAYDDLTDKLLARLPDGDVLAVTEGATLLAGHRRVTAGLHEMRSCHGGYGYVDPDYTSAKVDAAEQVCRDAMKAGAQCVMFTWHKAPARALAARLGAALVTGDYTTTRRAVEVARFKRGEVGTLVATMATLSESVNLQCASHVGLLEESWEPMHNDQAIGRVVRQGQTAHAVVHRWRCIDTVDGLTVAPRVESKTQLRKLLVGR